VNNSHSKIIAEIEYCLSKTNFDSYEEFINYLVQHRKVVLFGAGRVGLVLRTFAMRLVHMGFDAHFLGDATVPNLKAGELMIIGSGSGSTQSVLKYAEIANQTGINVALITATIDSPISKIAKIEFILNTPSKTKGIDSFTSQQPMTTLFEQTLLVFLDGLVLDLMNILDINSDQMWSRHNAIE
jgi:6-phospho-3-hexuloisomerase